MAVSGSVDICNMALDHLGKPSITSLTEGTTEAQACLRQYDIARRMCLARSPWTFARKYRRMSRLSDNPLGDIWEFRYDLPNDALHIHKLEIAGTMPSSNDPPQPHYIETGTVYTNLPDAMCLYTMDSEDVPRWSSLFDDVVALFLATRLAPGMTRRKSDVTTFQDMYRVALAEAVEQDAQQEMTYYTYYRGGYTDARGGGTGRSGRQPDGSVIWE